MQRSFSVAAVAAVVALSGSVHAGLTHTAITAPGGFVQAGANNVSPGSSLIPGGDLLSFFPAGSDEHEQSFSGNTQATTSASFSNASVTNSSSALAGLGKIKLSASNLAPNNSSFARAAAHGGWNETMTVVDPAKTGQSGFALVDIQVSGTLNAAGFAGLSEFWLTAYKNGQELTIYGGTSPYIDRGNSDLISTDRQRFRWSVATDFVGDVDSKAVDDVVTLAVPVTYGQSFTLGIYAYASAGMRSSSGVPGSSSSSLDFSHSLYWGGISSMMVGGSPAPGFTVNSASGINWANPIPEPTSIAAIVLGAVGLIRRPRPA